MIQHEESVPADRVIELTRVIDAPRALVFAAWTDVRHLDQWWGPKGFTVETHSADLRVGGAWRFLMRGPNGQEYANRITFREIVANERIVYDHDADTDDDPNGFWVTATFEDLGGKTRITMRSVLMTAEARAHAASFGAIELGQTTLDKLAAHARQLEASSFAPGEIRLERTFAAPRSLVFAAFVEPARFAAWFGPHDVAVPVCELDARVGGKIRFCHAPVGAHVLWLHGEYTAVVAPEQLAFDLYFTDELGKPTPPSFLPDWPVEAKIQTHVTLSESGGHTTVRVVQQVSPPSAATRPVVATERKMAREGWGETLDRLGTLVEG